LLILPLHRRVTRRNFPFVTLALVLANFFVFFALQSGDAVVTQRALAYYGQTSLGQVELPAYREWLATHGGDDADERRAFLEQAAAVRSGLAVMVLQSDTKFLKALRGGQVITPEMDTHTRWKEERAAFDALWSRRFTDSHALTYDGVDPARILWSMFMHGGIGHLVGNMIFLVLLGLLVEGALGELLFAAVYIAGGIGAALVSLALRYGDSGFLVGASGAIAGLMGAYCVLWGMRKVRFFYWFVVVFDYVRAPAIVLLPAWLGWEVLQWLFSNGSNVAFDAHAGGIVSGALLAAGVRTLGWERREFLDEDEKAEQKKQDQTDLTRALEHLGRLEIAQARALLGKLDATGPSLEIRVALYRCARYANNIDELHVAARHALSLPQVGVAVPKLKEIFDDYRKATGDRVRLEPALMLTLARAWTRLGAVADARLVLRALALRHSGLPGLPDALLELARRSPEASAPWRDDLGFLVEKFPQSPVAQKAGFLLAQAG
jgi:membrane associated rhomboid family serine protease